VWSRVCARCVPCSSEGVCGGVGCEGGSGGNTRAVALAVTRLDCECLCVCEEARVCLPRPARHAADPRVPTAGLHERLQREAARHALPPAHVQGERGLGSPQRQAARCMPSSGHQMRAHPPNQQPPTNQSPPANHQPQEDEQQVAWRLYNTALDKMFSAPCWRNLTIGEGPAFNTRIIERSLPGICVARVQGGAELRSGGVVTRARGPLCPAVFARPASADGTPKRVNEGPNMWQVRRRQGSGGAAPAAALSLLVSFVFLSEGRLAPPQQVCGSPAARCCAATPIHYKTSIYMYLCICICICMYSLCANPTLRPPGAARQRSGRHHAAVRARV
jgi:hypothetical protein